MLGLCLLRLLARGGPLGLRLLRLLARSGLLRLLLLLGLIPLLALWRPASLASACKRAASSAAALAACRRDAASRSAASLRFSTVLPTSVGAPCAAARPSTSLREVPRSVGMHGA